MKFSEVVAQTLAWLQREGRVSYRALRLEFALTEDVLDALKEELLFSHPEIADVDGRRLVWNGPELLATTQASEVSPHLPIPNPQLPVSYTPPHLAERIRAGQVAMEARGASDGERKTITALFADI